MIKGKSSKSIFHFSKILCSEQLGNPLGRVEKKFIENMLYGIHGSRSVNLTGIARELGESIKLHATQKRLSRNLDNLSLAQNLSSRLLKLSAKKVSPKTRLIVHVYELNKKYANKIEYLPNADDEKVHGFKVCEILSSEIGSENFIPLSSRVWSNEVPGYVSDNEEIRKIITDVLSATHNRGLFYFDDKTIPDNLLTPLIEDNDIKFIAPIRNPDITVSYKNKNWSPQELAQQVETRYGQTMFKLVPEGTNYFASKTDIDLFIQVGAIPVKLAGYSRSLSLIALKANNSFTGEFTTPYITSRTDLNSRKTLMGLMESWLSIQDILEAHKKIRTEFQPEHFRVLTHNRLRLLMTLLQAVMQFEVLSSADELLPDHQIRSTPRTGNLDRTYLMPRDKR